MAHSERHGRIKNIKEPAVPLERYETIRKHITALLQEETLSAKDLSQSMRIPEKDISGHLEHIKKTLSKNNQRLVVIPAQCEKCGFVYKKRERFSKPGKCPVCRESLIRPPLFHIGQTG